MKMETLGEFPGELEAQAAQVAGKLTSRVAAGSQRAPTVRQWVHGALLSRAVCEAKLASIKVNLRSGLFTYEILRTRARTCARMTDSKLILVTKTCPISRRPTW